MTQVAAAAIGHSPVRLAPEMVSLARQACSLAEQLVPRWAAVTMVAEQRPLDCLRALEARADFGTKAGCLVVLNLRSAGAAADVCFTPALRAFMLGFLTDPDLISSRRRG